MNSRRYVAVPVSVLWTSPTAPRDVDAHAVAPRPQVVAWLRDLDATKERLGLHGRVLTQLELGEPVDITGEPDEHSIAPPGSADDGWLQVVAPMQPSSLDARGYPGWLLAAHVDTQVPLRSPLSVAADTLEVGADSLEAGADSLEAGAGRQAFIAQARGHLGVPYLWGGMCNWALDCSGLVHLSLRRLGVVFPRDADDQYDACEHIPAADARPGDLFFFAHDGKRPHHVGIVTAPGRMLHAPETGSAVIEEALTATRRGSLIGGGRLSSLLARTASTGPTGPTG